MKLRTFFGSSLALALSFIIVSPAQAIPFFGKKEKTEVEDGSPDMSELGDYKGLKHAIGCTDFDNQAGWSGQWKLGNNLSVMLEAALQETGRFVLVERDKLGAVLNEQDLVASGRAAATKKVAKTGEIRPARYIATGSITEAEESTSGGGGGISIKGIRLGGGKSKATVTIIAKLVDTTTSEIVAQKRITGKAGRVKVNVGASISGVSGNLGGFEAVPLGEAAQDCINEAAKFFAKQMEEIPFEGSVVMVKSGRIIINRGSNFGVQTGQVLEMVTQGEALIDPDTGENLGFDEGETLGKIKVTKVTEKVSYCEVVDGEKEPERGTVVKLVK